MRHSLNLLTLSLGIFFQVPALGFEVTFGSDVSVSRVGKDLKEKIQMGEKFQVSEDQAIWAEAENRLPVLILAISKKANKTEINLPLIETYQNDLHQKKLDPALSEILSQIADIKALMTKRNFSASRSRIQQLQGLYPQLKIVDFLLASQLYLEGNREGALQLAEEAMQYLPNYVEGQTFVDQLRRKKN